MNLAMGNLEQDFSQFLRFFNPMPLKRWLSIHQYHVI